MTPLCSFFGCQNDPDPRWGGYCDGHGATTPEELARRMAEEKAAVEAVWKAGMDGGLVCPVCSQAHATDEATSSCCDVEHLWKLLADTQKALHAAREKNELLLEVFRAAKSMRDIGYDGSFMGGATEALFGAIRKVEEGH